MDTRLFPTLVTCLWLLGISPALAGPRSNQPPRNPAPALTQAEQNCKYYGEWISAIANTRDEGISYLEALTIVRGRQDYRVVSPQAKARMERDVQGVYELSWVSASELRNLMETSCIRATSPTTGTSATTPQY